MNEQAYFEQFAGDTSETYSSDITERYIHKQSGISEPLHTEGYYATVYALWRKLPAKYQSTTLGQLKIDCYYQKIVNGEIIDEHNE